MNDNKEKRENKTDNRQKHLLWDRCSLFGCVVGKYVLK